MVPASKKNFLQRPVDSHKLRFRTRYEFTYGVNPAGNTNTYRFMYTLWACDRLGIRRQGSEGMQSHA